MNVAKYIHQLDQMSFPDSWEETIAFLREVIDEIERRLEHGELPRRED